MLINNQVVFYLKRRDISGGENLYRYNMKIHCYELNRNSR